LLNQELAEPSGGPWLHPPTKVLIKKNKYVPKPEIVQCR
jgi:hypothetical protein